MKYLLILICCIAIAAIMLILIVPLEQRLDDCHFECNHLQMKLARLEELNNYIPAMEQILNPLQLAELKVTTEMIRQKKYQEYEGRELPLIGE